MDRITLELISADPAASLRRLQQDGVLLENVDLAEELTLRFEISQTEAHYVMAQAQRYGETCRPVHHRGMVGHLTRILHRPVLWMGMVLLLFLSLWVPSRIFFVQVEGNVQVSTTQIVALATECGLSFGSCRRDLRSQQIQNALLEAVPELQWVGVNTKGCVAVISVRERSKAQETQPPVAIGSIVALRDGVIAEMTVLQGTALCQPGQAVSAGQVLISGYTDCGICIRAEQAKGEVFAYTSRVISAVIPTEYALKQPEPEPIKKYSLIIGKKRIFFSNSSGNLGESCAKIYLENYMTLPGGFRLPIALVTEVYGAATTSALHADSLQTELERYSQDYVLSQMLAGAVLHKAAILTEYEGALRLDTVYSCREMIGRFRPEENLPNYEND